jgi:prophage regulatory protein
MQQGPNKTIFMEESKMKQTTLLRMPQVEAICGLKKSAIYLKVKSGEFPEPVYLGAKHVAWRSDDIENWILSRPKVALCHPKAEFREVAL